MERPVAIAQQHRHDAGPRDVVAGVGQVDPPVAVEVPRDQRRHIIDPRRVVHGPLERPVAVAQQHRHAAGAGIGQVDPPVAVEVPRDQRRRIDPRRVVHGLLERPVAVAQQHRHAAGAGAPARSTRPSPLKSPATSAVTSLIPAA